MLFTEPTFLAFIAIVFVAYWGLRQRVAQNVLLVIAACNLVSLVTIVAIWGGAGTQGEAASKT